MIFCLRSQVVFVTLLCLSCLQMGCSLFGTGTGNPFAQHNGSTSVFGAGSVANEACMTTVRCHAEAKFDDCRRAVWNFTTLAEKLGLPAAPIRTVVEIEDLERNGALVVNSSALHSCLVAVRSLDCASPGAVGAYDAAQAIPYIGVANILTPGCTDIFR